MAELHECITCYDKVNVLPGFNCQRCASGAGSPVQGVQPLQPIPVRTYNDVPEEVIKENARLLSEALVHAFGWAATGDPTYWRQVYQRIRRIAEDGYPK